MIWRLVMVLVALCGGCEQSVHVRLFHDPEETAVCNQAIIQTTSFYIRLLRVEGGEERTFEKCTSLSGVNLENLDDLEGILAERSSFPDVPTGGIWSIAVQGFDDACCRNMGKFPLLCGAASGFSMPPPDNQVTVRLQCIFVKEQHEDCPCEAPDWCPTDSCR